MESQAGDTICVNPDEVHDGVPISDAPRAWLMVYLDPSVVGPIVADLTEGRLAMAEFTQPMRREGGMGQCFQAFFQALTTKGVEGGGSLRRDECLLALVGRLIQDGPLPRGGPVPDAIRLAKSLIDDDPAAALTLADLSHASGLTRFQVVRGFARSLGLTPHAYLMQRRVNLARQLIGRGVSLADAAGGSGFADQSHMTRLFVRCFGISPGACAEAMR